METNTTPVDYNNRTDIFKDDPYALLRTIHHTTYLVVYCLSFVLGVLGNGVVIWMTGFKIKKTVKTIWFLNIILADFIYTVFIPLHVTHIILDFHWPFGNFMCKLYGTIGTLNMFASVYILVVISVDRCVCVVWPVWTKNHRNVRKASYASLGAWILALILSAPYFAFRETGLFANGKIVCFSYNRLSHIIDLTRFLLGFVGPFTIIVACYAVIIHRLRRNRTLASQSSRPIKIITAFITIFVLCWAPLHIISLFQAFHKTYTYQSKILFMISFFGKPFAVSIKNIVGSLMVYFTLITLGPIKNIKLCPPFEICKKHKTASNTIDTQINLSSVTRDTANF